MNLTATDFKKLNYNKVYQAIYNNPDISRQEIIPHTQLSLPTVVQNINELLKNNLIKEEGLAKSTGGRPSIVYRINEVARVSVGVELLPAGVTLAIVDLYGNIQRENSLDKTFVNSPQYFEAVSAWINSEISSFTKETSSILGITFAIPGIISSDRIHITYSEILHTHDFSLNDFSEHLNYPCAFLHDAEAGAQAEVWHGEQINNALCLFLSNYFYNALILHGDVMTFSDLSSGTLEHMLLHTNGHQCYCGKKGCVDAYCSALSLMRRIGSNDLDRFFVNLRAGDYQAVQLWSDYLDDLALTIDNSRMIVACDVLITGLLHKYFIQEDIELLKNKVLAVTTFKSVDFDIKLGFCGKKGVLLGAAIPQIKEFLSEV